MSLDVYLYANTPSGVRNNGSGIFIRENGEKREISRAEWDEKFPGREPVVALKESDDCRQVYSRNITHNLTSMADEAGIYKALWRPDENGITTAKQLIPILEAGLELLLDDPDRFEKFNPSNGWGDYEGLVRFTEGYLAACREYPDATVDVSR